MWRLKGKGNKGKRKKKSSFYLRSREGDDFSKGRNKGR